VTGRNGVSSTWPVVLRRVLEDRKSKDRFCEAGIEVKIWQKGLPPVEAVRPARCPRCGHPGAAAGERVGLLGHGVRERQVRGPGAAFAAPEVGSVLLRRYRCRECSALVTVGPRGLCFRRLYTSPAIALALALWACRRAAAPAVRCRVSPWRIVGAAAAAGWASLRRWAQAAVTGALWPGLLSTTEPTLRQGAARVVHLLAAMAPGGEVLEVRAFAGGHLLR
jgi:hypothetical protein